MCIDSALPHNKPTNPFPAAERLLSDHAAAQSALRDAEARLATVEAAERDAAAAAGRLAREAAEAVGGGAGEGDGSPFVGIVLVP